jgi:hypothetical protein
MLRYDRVKFDYEPYPIGLISKVFDDKLYERLVNSYPDKSLFRHMPHLGNKYSLAGRNNGAEYKAFLKSSPDWRDFYDYVSSPEFIEKTLSMLQDNHIDLVLRKPKVMTGKGRRNKSSLLGRMLGWTELNARFEFSMMDGEGGHIKPHTDLPQKLITFVFSMNRPGDWDSNWGGTTDVVWPKDTRYLYNHGNKYFGFDEVSTLKKMDYNPNQAVIFIKTWNSWHAVSPLHAPVPGRLRKTLTVNIERKV